GIWKPQALARLMAGDEQAAGAEPPGEPAPIPEYLPNQIEVYIGRDDLFPYQVDYLRAAHPGKHHDHDRLLAKMKFVDVHFDLPIEGTQFVHPPSEGVPVDDTEAFLRRVLPR